MRLEALTEAHVRALQPQAAQSDLSTEDRVALALAQADAGLAYAALEDDTVVCAGGVVCDESWPGRGVVWAIVGEGAPMRPLTRIVRTWLDGLPLPRLELYVDAQFLPGCKWARLLGFELETPLPMRRFLPNGNAAYMFGRVQ